jgi:iron(III) transport system ATP-binding protein
MVFQNYALYPHMTVYENMAFSLKLAHMSKDEIDAKVQEAARILEITEILDRLPKALSGGQRQRVAIGRAIVRNPQVILMDEPLSNLDAKLRVQLREELKKMQREFGITSIYVTHDQEEALTLSDRIAVFNRGVIEQIGTPNDIYNHSATEFVCNFIGDINRLSGPVVQTLIDSGASLDPNWHHYVRLERVHVNEAARPGTVAIPGKVVSREYYGLYIKYYVDLGSQTIKVMERNDGVHIYDPGEAVRVNIDPADLMSYAPTGEEGRP